ncbi:hypothetical protein QL285_084999 [Trifolium repens]|jgi:hypothetical protein|nr:hypothetical protein QL285_084999 [Trifolium repens]
MRKLGFGTTMHHEEASVDSKIGKGETSSKISGATTNCDGKCDFQKKRSDFKIVKCSSKWKKSIKPTRKLKMDGFVAFNDDYHGPRHHLPKHN